jgi:hypothetical protein
MSGCNRDVNRSAVNAVGYCALSFLLSTAAGGVSASLSASGQPPPQTPVLASSAATSQSLYIPSAGGGVRDAPFDPWNPDLTPMPAPITTNHYAGLVESYVEKPDAALQKCPDLHARSAIRLLLTMGQVPEQARTAVHKNAMTGSMPINSSIKIVAAAI